MSLINAFKTATLQSAAGATGNGTAIDVPGYNTIGLNVLITATATVTFEGTLDGTNWVSLQAVNVADGTSGATATASGVFRIVAAGLYQVRARVSAFTSGTVTVTAYASAGGGSGGGGSVTINTSDIQLGSVEIKNATDDTRATVTGDGLEVSLGSLIAGEDLTVGVMKTEERFSGVNVTSDTQIKAGAGFVHTITFSCNDAAPTAGSIIAYDSLTETGTIVYSETFDTTAFRGYSVLLDRTFSTGLYVGFTTTADVNVAVSYR